MARLRLRGVLTESRSAPPVGIVVIRTDAPELDDGLTGRGLSLVQLSGAGIGVRTLRTPGSVTAPGAAEPVFQPVGADGAPARTGW